MPGIIEYDAHVARTYRYTWREAIRYWTRRLFFTVTYPLFAAIRAWHRYQLRNLR